MNPYQPRAARRTAQPNEEHPMAEISLPENIASYEATGPCAPTGEVAAVRPARPARLRPWTKWLEPASLVPTYVGIVVIAVGFALIGVSWAEIAALTDVGLQMPYLVSAGFTGLGLVMLGLIIVNIAAKRQDAAERSRQMQTLTETFQALRQEIARLDSRADRR